MNEEQVLKEKIVELEKQIHDLEKDLIHDGLTSLRTRTFFEEEIRVYLSAIKDADTHKRRDWFGFKNLCILFFDIDHFKKINDTYGHDTGDLVLRDVAGLINKSVREGDTVARWGGEEMVVSLLGANESDAKNKAEEIRKSVESLVWSDIPDLKVTISIGVSSYVKDISLEDMIKNADKALYQAKETGRNKVVAYSELK